MKKTLILSISACLVALLLPSTAMAAKGAKGEKRGVRPAQILKQYDANTDGKIDGAESEALRKAFAGDAKLKSLDLNADGKLDDAEIASIKGRGGAKAGKAGKRKKNQ